MNITSEEIAKLANVSRSTVSRVINHYPNVPEETRIRVMDVIEKYGYQPNTFAQVLAGKAKPGRLYCVFLIVMQRREDGEVSCLPISLG